MDYFVFYVKGCTPKVKKFKTLKSAEDFSNRLFAKKDEDNWVDYVIKGDFVSVFEESKHLLKYVKSYGKTSKVKTRK